MITHSPRQKSVSIIERSSPGYSVAYWYRARRLLPSGMYLQLLYNGAYGGIVTEDQDAIKNATMTVLNSNFVNANLVKDYNDATYGYLNSVSVGPNTEVDVLMFDLGYIMGGLVLFVYMNTNTVIRFRVYTSSDGTTWSLATDTNATGDVLNFGLWSVRYMKVSVFNSGTSSYTLTSTNFRLYSFEYYPQPFGTKVFGNDTVKMVTAFARNAYYQLLEVWEL